MLLATPGSGSASMVDLRIQENQNDGIGLGIGLDFGRRLAVKSLEKQMPKAVRQFGL